MFKNFNVTKIQLYVILSLACLSVVVIVFSIFRVGNLLSPDYLFNSGNKNSSSHQTNNSGATNTPNPNTQQPDSKSSNTAQFNFTQVGPASDAGKGINSTLDGFYKALNNQQYDQALGFLDPSFVEKNSITSDKLKAYFQNEYPQNITYQIDSIFKENTSLYHVKIVINNPDPAAGTYYYVYDAGANYYFKDIDGTFKISIPYMIGN